ncbi:hypothetical protein BRADI_3g06546v3 [Brachypodium distachyon]|uniref:SGNH hydrolase-type esterase domain-containing protein n=1 Tax=Brachypodium distachyon TaxID=15368 RepID=A0A2K2CVK8_BRADI|nr:hypothetical protein BRADI_3g06546v3 [Brachypodium distachyon]
MNYKFLNLQSVLTIWEELDYFKEYAARLRGFQGEEKAAQTLAEALYVVSMGTNDFLENYYAVPQGRASQYPTAAAYGRDYLLGAPGSFVRALHALGARKLDLNGLPPMGCLPMESALDAIHPTERLHRALADAKMNATLHVFL